MPLRTPEAESKINWTEVFDARRRSDATPLVEPFSGWAILCVQSPELIPFFAVACAGNKILVENIKYLVRRSYDEEFREKQKIINAQNAGSRKAYYDERRKDPAYRKAHSARGIARFHAKRQEIYAYRNHRRATDKNFQISSNLRTYMYQHLGIKRKKESRIVALVGCSTDELVKHLESTFKPGMTWENYGFYGWHVDHVKPCAAFDLTDPEQQKACFNFKNLQALWREENLSKSAKLPAAA